MTSGAAVHSEAIVRRLKQQSSVLQGKAAGRRNSCIGRLTSSLEAHRIRNSNLSPEDLGIRVCLFALEELVSFALLGAKVLCARICVLGEVCPYRLLNFLHTRSDAGQACYATKAVVTTKQGIAESDRRHVYHARRK